MANDGDPWPLHRFVVKSTTEGNDLFYRFDTLARFHEAQINAQDSLRGEQSTSPNPVDLLRYLQYDALGKAILFSLGKQACVAMNLIAEKMAGDAWSSIPDNPTRSVVLIDEIDKAPRDVPNDILDEIEKLSFRVRELDNVIVEVNPKMRPIVVITSNSERDLPKPFLRRCIYYHMGFPEMDQLREIVNKRVGKRFEKGEDFLSQALSFFHYLRKHIDLNHQPGLAELLDWLNDVSSQFEAVPDDLLKTKVTLKNTLLKDKDDQQLANQSWEDWVKAWRKDSQPQRQA